MFIVLLVSLSVCIKCRSDLLYEMECLQYIILYLATATDSVSISRMSVCLSVCLFGCL